jgi:hypothetical protein
MEFSYGWRYVTRIGTNGNEEVDQIPLTLEDVLHPQEDDVIPQSTQHSDECIYIQHACRTRLYGVTGVLVLNDCLIDSGATQASAPCRPTWPSSSTWPTQADGEGRFTRLMRERGLKW